MRIGYGKHTVCRDCTDRVVGCHGSCEKYISEKAEAKEKSDSIKKEKQLYLNTRRRIREDKLYRRKKRR